jgi:hypothetical protein
MDVDPRACGELLFADIVPMTYDWNGTVKAGLVSAVLYSEVW